MRRQNQKDVGGTKTRYLYDGLQMIAEYDGSGTLQKKYVYGTGLDEVLIELDSSNNKTYLHHDRKGSIIATTNSSGAVINSYAYSPFGESGSLSGTTFGYTGQRSDPETGLYYYKNRHYSPELGRFLQPDLIGYADGLNVYQYGYNDPNTFSDPLGLAADGSRLGSDTGSGAGAIGQLVAGGVAGIGGWYAFGTYVLAGSQNFGQAYAYGATYGPVPGSEGSSGGGVEKWTEAYWAVFDLRLSVTFNGVKFQLNRAAYHVSFLAKSSSGRAILIGFWPYVGKDKKKRISSFPLETNTWDEMLIALKSGAGAFGAYANRNTVGSVADKINAPNIDALTETVINLATFNEDVLYQANPGYDGKDFLYTSNQMIGELVKRGGGVVTQGHVGWLIVPYLGDWAPPYASLPKVE